MGLDQYAYAKKLVAQMVFDFVEPEFEDGEYRFYYWRGHNRLHGWMERHYRGQGGDEEFNCVPVELTSEDVKTLLHDIRNKDFPRSAGFFFGEDSYEDYVDPENGRLQEDLEFVNEAKKRLDKGWKVYYSSWW